MDEELSLSDPAGADTCERPYFDTQRTTTMQFFTAAWASGNLDDIEAEAVVERYNDHLAMFDRGGEVYRFATTVSLNDAYLDRLMIDPITPRVELLLLTGDLQVGYWRTTLSYGSAWVADGEVALKRGLSLRPSEIW